MRVTETSAAGRDLRIDIVRAFALITIFINHIPGTLLERATLKNFGFADAAEIFVLISGMAVALSYGKRWSAGQRFLGTVKMWQRAGVLYCAHIMTTVATLTIFCAAAVLAHQPQLLQLNNINVLIDDTAEAFVGVGLLGHQLGYNNILSMYAVLMLAAPLGLWGLIKNIPATLAVSGALWLAAGLWQIAPPNYPTPGFWFLNPLSWQFLFVIGMAAAMRPFRIPLWAAILSAAYLLLAFATIHSPLWGKESWFSLPIVLGGFDKTFLSLPRLLDVLALACVAISSGVLGPVERSVLGRPLAILGRYSLSVFVAGTILAMIGQVLRTIAPQSLAFDLTLIGTGTGLQFALAYYLDWLRRMRATTSATGFTPLQPAMA